MPKANKKQSQKGLQILYKNSYDGGATFAVQAHKYVLLTNNFEVTGRISKSSAKHPNGMNGAHSVTEM
jgi:hypothetical protein